VARRWIGTVFCTALVAALSASQPTGQPERALAATCDAPSEEAGHEPDLTANPPALHAGSIALGPPSRGTGDSSTEPPASPARLAALVLAPKTSPPARR
jgi:hypothetical protein